MNRKQKQLSQRTLVQIMRALDGMGMPSSDMEEGINFTQLLFESDFPAWFVHHARDYNFHWQEIIIDLRTTKFFYPGHCDAKSNITGSYLATSDALAAGEEFNRRLAAHATTTESGDAVRRSLELDGFRVKEGTFELIPVEAVVNEQEEEGRVVTLVRTSRITDSETILKHLRDAQELFVGGKDHSSIGEGRSFVQAIIDAIGAETHAHGGHSAPAPTNMKERFQYLQDVGFFTTDERTAFGSVWGFLSGGSHPGIPSREEARIGLILALEFGQLLLLKYANWSANNYQRFS